MTLTTKDAGGFIAGVSEGTMGKEEKKEETATYEVLSGFCLGEAENVFAGDVVELPESQARRWLGRGYIEKTNKKVQEAPPNPEHRKAVKKVKNQDPAAVQNRDPR